LSCERVPPFVVLPVLQLLSSESSPGSLISCFALGAGAETWVAGIPLYEQQNESHHSFTQ
jgi:hypothetical protein